MKKFLIERGEHRNKSIDGYNCNFIERKIINKQSGKVLWHGELTDVGAGSDFDYFKGEAVGYTGFKSYISGEELGKKYGLTMSELIIGSNELSIELKKEKLPRKVEKTKKIKKTKFADYWNVKKDDY